MKQYHTKNGDTWDRISYEQLGSEYLLPLLLEANQEYRNVVIFEAGVTLNIPDAPTEAQNERPDWLNDEMDGSPGEAEPPWKLEDEFS